MHALRLTAVCAFIALWLVTPWPAAACSCMLDRSPARLKTLFDNTDLVVEGIVKSETRRGPALVFAVDVIQVWRGDATSTVELMSDVPNGGNCAAYLQFERPMLLTAHASATGNLWTTMCDRNMPIELAGPELAVLGPGQRVSQWWVSAPALIGEAVLAGLVALGGLSFWLNRRDTRKATHNTGA